MRKNLTTKINQKTIKQIKQDCVILFHTQSSHELNTTLQSRGKPTADYK